MVLKCLGFCRSSQRHYPTVIEEQCHHFSLADVRKSTNNFDESQMIGEGGFGKVYQGCLQHNVATPVAVKRMSEEGSTYGLRDFKNEIKLLCQLRHPNLVSLTGFCNHKNEKILVHEYVSNGSLRDHLYNRDMEPLSWKKICIGATSGLHYLHSGTKDTIFHHHSIQHRNILLDGNMVPKLSGFGKPKPFVGTFGYIAPEFRSYGWTDKYDVYSFGVVLLEVVCEKDEQAIVYKTNKLKQVLEPVESEKKRIHSFVVRYPVEEIIKPYLMGKIAPKCWEIFMDITVRCLMLDPKERPLMGEVEVQLEHALSLQEEADIRKICDDYTLSFTTIFTF